MSVAPAESELDRDRPPTELHAEVSERDADFEGPVRELIAATLSVQNPASSAAAAAPLTSGTSSRLSICSRRASRPVWGKAE